MGKDDNAELREKCDCRLLGSGPNKMNADIVINDFGPRLVPFGCFEILLPAVMHGLEKCNDIDLSGIINEWRGELYLDDFDKDNFNVVIQSICEYVSNRRDSNVESEVFVNFWNVTLLPIIRADPRYTCDYQNLT